MTTEILPYTDYLLREERPSQINPDATIDAEVGMRCPRCKTVLPALKHGEAQSCANCELFMQRWGNGLHCRI